MRHRGGEPILHPRRGHLEQQFDGGIRRNRRGERGCQRAPAAGGAQQKTAGRLRLQKSSTASPQLNNGTVPRCFCIDAARPEE
jgi:hypothetical protein